MRVAVLFLIGLALAGCGGSSSEPPVAILTSVEADEDRVTFAFRSPPRNVTARYVSRDELVEDGSGLPARVAGSAFLVVRFEPASGMNAYTGARRLAPRGTGSVREVVRLGDFEAVLTWAIGLSGRRPYSIDRNGDRVSVEVG